MKCSNCSKGIVLLVIVIGLLVGAYTVFRFGFSRVNLPPRFAEGQFKEFIRGFNRSYDGDPAEYQKRYNIFMTNLKNIIEKNIIEKEMHKGGNDTLPRFGVTNFTDMTEAEFVKQHLDPSVGQNYKLVANTSKVFNVNKYRSYYNYPPSTNFSELPQRVDWREKNKVSAVRKQGACGACWAYSVISTIESFLQINKGLERSLSIQQMIDCAQNGNKGCSGGHTCLLLQWLKKEKVPILTESDYPLNPDHSSTCKNGVSADEHYVRVVNYTCDSFVNKEDQLLEAINFYGPVTVAVNALLWQNYLGGVIQYHCDGSIQNLNHAVEIVGYDRSGPVPYYIVKNSWGTQYGDKGYMRIAIGNNVCGIANQVSMVMVDEF